MNVTRFADIGNGNGLERVSVKLVGTGKRISAEVLSKTQKTMRVVTENDVTINMRRETKYSKFLGRVGDMEFESWGTL